MSGQAKTVLWIGLFLIAAQLITGWSTLKQIIFSNPNSPASSGSGSGPIPLWELPLYGLPLVHRTPSASKAGG